jgi:DnaK suppressor protein
MASERITSGRVGGGTQDKSSATTPTATEAGAPSSMATTSTATQSPATTSAATESAATESAASRTAATVPAAREPTTKQVGIKAAPRRGTEAPDPTADVVGAVRMAALPVVPERAVDADDTWTHTQLVALRAELAADREALRQTITDAERALVAIQGDGSGEGAGDDQVDAGTKTFEREHEMSLAQNSKDLLSQVERALGRIDDRTYGACESCGRPIAKARLQAFPRATLCVSCKQREERR